MLHSQVYHNFLSQQRNGFVLANLAVPDVVRGTISVVEDTMRVVRLVSDINRAVRLLVDPDLVLVVIAADVARSVEAKRAE